MYYCIQYISLIKGQRLPNPLSYFSTVFRVAHYPLKVRIWRYLPCGRWKKHAAPLKIAEIIAPAVMSTVVKFQVGKIRPRRPTSPLLGHFRPFLANRIQERRWFNMAKH